MCKTTEGGFNLALYFTIIILTCFNLSLLLVANHFWTHNPDMIKTKILTQGEHDFEPNTYTHCIAYWKVPMEE
jgi:hypothetical protein